MKNDLNELKKLVYELAQSNGEVHLDQDQTAMLNKLYKTMSPIDEGHMLQPGTSYSPEVTSSRDVYSGSDVEDVEEHEEVEESLSLEDREKELIKKALEKHRGKRKYAARELGISERTLYRKIKEYDLN